VSNGLTPDGKLKDGDGGAVPMVYLGGGRSDLGGVDWRDEFRQRFMDHMEGTTPRPKYQRLMAHDPFKMGRQGAMYEFTNDDLGAVSRSSLVIAHVDFARYTGLALEVGYAKALEIPIMLIWAIGGRVDAMMSGCAKWMFTDYHEALNYLEDKLL